MKALQEAKIEAKNNSGDFQKLEKIYLKIYYPNSKLDQILCGAVFGFDKL